MIVMKKLPISNAYQDFIIGALSTFIERYLDDTPVKSVFRDRIYFELSQYSTLGCHFIGYWKYDTETNNYILDGFDDLFLTILNRYIPHLKMLEEEFSSITGIETLEKSGDESNSLSSTETNGNTRNKDDTFTNNTHGTNRSAVEDSPITSSAINSAPTESDTWNISNPIRKDGEQFDHHNTSQNTSVTVDSGSKSDSSSGSKNYGENISRVNPEIEMKVLRMNVDNFNLEKVVRMIINSIVFEKAKVY